MLVCEVIGNVWATKKEERLAGLKLMVVRRTDPGQPKNQETFVAADIVGAGIGEQVLVVSGSTARCALNKEQSPVDAAIVGIIDALEVELDG